jgi:hypothetical protein
MGFNETLNKYEGAFGKLGILLVVTFLLMILAGVTDLSQAGKIMSVLLFILLIFASFIGYTISKSLD